MRALSILPILWLGSCASPAQIPLPKSADSREGIRWLFRHQGDDGSWSARTRWSCGCDLEGDEKMDVARTAMVLLALMSADWAPVPENEKRKGGAVCISRGIRWLLQRQNSEGAIGAATMDHALATHALVAAHFSCREVAEFAAEDDNKQPLFWAAKREMEHLERPTQAAIQYLLRSRTRSGAWDSPVVSAWCVRALEGARIAKLSDDRSWVDDVVRWFTAMVNDRSDRVSIAAALTATCELLGEKPMTSTTRSWKRVLLSNLPSADSDSLYGYWGTAGLFAYFRPGMRICIPIDAWQKAKVEALSSRQRHDVDSCDRGSWRPGPGESEVGRAWVTALAVRSLLFTQVSRGPFVPPIQDD